MILDLTEAGPFTTDLLLEAEKMAFNRTGEYPDQAVLTPEQKADLYNEIALGVPPGAVTRMNVSRLNGIRIYTTDQE